MTTTSGVDSQTVLNNYIASQKAASKSSTSTTTTSSDSAKLAGSYDTFLKILTTQLQNQDPTSPVDASQFTQQLVQYSQVEQQINTNSKLESILTSLNSNGITPLMSYVGQYVEAKADGQLEMQGGSAKLAYTLPETAQSVKIYVKNSAGTVLATIDGVTTKGLNRVAWDGTCDDGTKAADGTYKFTITAKDSSAKAIDITDTRVIGLVTGIETDSSGAATLKLSNMSIKDTDVKSVFSQVSTSSSSNSSSSSS